MSTSKQRVSHKVSTFTESVIREMTRLALDHNAINLAQEFPNFPAPQSIKEAAGRLRPLTPNLAPCTLSVRWLGSQSSVSGQPGSG